MRAGDAGAGDPPLRYRAFLSYSHRDAALSQRLHRRLEGYRIPRAVRRGDGSAPPSRLHPIFRDRDELATAGQLSQSIEQALAESAALVVVCSPAAVASAWVDAEIAWFRRHHPQRPVFAFVVAGDPGRDPRLDPAAAALPLRLLLADPDAVDGPLGEPLAADARAEADGFTSAFFKLVAGLAGVRYDDLRRRDQRRRQQRWMLASGSTLVLAAVFAGLALEATRARDAARAAQSLAELELRSERQTREFLLSVFQLADATEARGERVTVREVLDRAVDNIDRARFDRPALRARYLATMGQAYGSLGLNRRGVELLERSIAGLDGVEDPEAATQRLDSRIELADTLFDMGRYDDALAAISAFDAEPSAPTRLQQARMQAIRGNVLTWLDRDDAARAAYRHALATLAADDPADDAVLVRARAISGIAALALFGGDAAAARSGYAEALALLHDRFGDLHPAVIATRLSFGSASYRDGDRRAAREAWQGALRDSERVYDPDGPQIGTLKNNLGLLLLEDGDLAAAEPLLRDALASDRRHRSDSFDDLAYPLYNLGFLLLARGEHAEAAQRLDEGIAVAAASGHRMLGPLLAARADLHCLQDRRPEGEALAQRALAVLADDPDADPWRRAQARLAAAGCGMVAAPGEELDADHALLAARFGAASPFVRRAQQQLRANRR
jgi:tetratricopeptide (TPR) repeat protein